MIVVDSDCIGCPEDLGCVYEACPYYKVIRYYCDKCGCEDDLYEWDGDQLCAECILEQLNKVEYEEF